MYVCMYVCMYVYGGADLIPHSPLVACGWLARPVRGPRPGRRSSSYHCCYSHKHSFIHTYTHTYIHTHKHTSFKSVNAVLVVIEAAVEFIFFVGVKSDELQEVHVLHTATKSTHTYSLSIYQLQYIYNRYMHTTYIHTYPSKSNAEKMVSMSAEDRST